MEHIPPPVAALETQVLDFSPCGLRHPQPVEAEQGDQRVLGSGVEADGNQEGADLVTVQGGGV